VERKTREKRKRKKKSGRNKLRWKQENKEGERRKILKELRKEKHASYSSHNSCKSLNEELRDYYEGRHRAHLRPHSHWREKERKPQEANINLPYFHGKDNLDANLDWEIRVEQCHTLILSGDYYLMTCNKWSPETSQKSKGSRLARSVKFRNEAEVEKRCFCAIRKFPWLLRKVKKE